MMEPRLSYTADFGGGVSATTTFDYLRYFRTKDEKGCYAVQWTRHPSPELLRGRFLEWVEAVNSDIAKKINREFRYFALLGPEQWEAWTHYPNGLVKKEAV